MATCTIRNKGSLLLKNYSSLFVSLFDALIREATFVTSVVGVTAFALVVPASRHLVEAV